LQLTNRGKIKGRAEASVEGLFQETQQ